MSTPPDDGPAVPPAPLAPRRARAAVSLLFALMGITLGSWAARIPGVRAQVGVDDVQWGLIILAAPAGSLITLLIVTRLIGTVGARRLVLPGAVAVLVVVPVTAASGRIDVLLVAVFLQGAATGLLATPMNALAVLVEREYRRPIMSGFHAVFSLGQLSGGLAGAIAADLGVSPARQLSASGVLLGLALLGMARWVPRDHPALTPAARRVEGAAASGRRSRRVVTPQLLLLAGIALLSSINEGAAVQWSAQYGAVAGAAGASVGALVFSSFSVAMTAARLRGDRLAGRWGRVRFVRLSALLAGAGMAAGLIWGGTVGAFLAFALLGIGSGCIIPTVMALAGNQPGIAAGQGVAVASLGQWPAFLLGPPVIGALAGVVGLRWGLGLVVVSALLIAALAGRLRDPGQPERHVLPAP